jgi:hypothetical protein
VSEVPFKRAFSILIDSEYIGSGEYLPVIQNVYFTCTGCKKETPIEWEDTCEVGDDGPFI